jgi:hypothetical protein
VFGGLHAERGVRTATKQRAGAAIITIAVLRVLIEVAGEYLFFWYVIVRDIVYLRASLYPVSALLLSAGAIVGFVFLSAKGPGTGHMPRTARGLASVTAMAFVMGGAIYLAESVVRVGSLNRGQAWMGAGLAALTVGAWVGVSVATWILSVECIRRFVDRGARATA